MRYYQQGTGATSHRPKIYVQRGFPSCSPYKNHDSRVNCSVSSQPLNEIFRCKILIWWIELILTKGNNEQSYKYNTCSFADPVREFWPSCSWNLLCGVRSGGLCMLYSSRIYLWNGTCFCNRRYTSTCSMQYCFWYLRSSLRSCFTSIYSLNIHCSLQC